MAVEHRKGLGDDSESRQHCWLMSKVDRSPSRAQLSTPGSHVEQGQMAVGLRREPGDDRSLYWSGQTLSISGRIQ
eukprot:4169336-Heterocapsa_arctica.AAC.1